MSNTQKLDIESVEEILREEAGGASELAEGAYETGRKVAHLPD